MTDEKTQFKAIIEDDPYTLVNVGDEAEGFKVVAVEEGDDRRWSRWITIIVQAPSGKFYEWGYDHGLTEYQDDDFDSSELYEVTRQEETVVMVRWPRVKQAPAPKPLPDPEIKESW